MIILPGRGTNWRPWPSGSRRVSAPKARKDFWGYVWQGDAGEALTCNALEWQVAAGGGRIIEQDRTISVNNPAAIGAWERARRWIGWISPPGVVAYRETDTMLIFDSGRAAFNRIWILTPMTRSGQARQIGWRSSPPVVKTGFSRMPAEPKDRPEHWEGLARPSPYIRLIARKRSRCFGSSFAPDQEAKRTHGPAARCRLNSPIRRRFRTRTSLRNHRISVQVSSSPGPPSRPGSAYKEVRRPTSTPCIRF